MTLAELKTILAGTNLPIYYGHSKETQTLPYIVYEVAYNNDFVADGINYHKIKHIDLSLYTDKKSETLEGTIEDVLNNNGIVYSKTEQYSYDERVYQIIFEFEI